MSLSLALLTLALADCDEIVAAPSGDLYLACHSPSDNFTVNVNGRKPNDVMDGYVIRLRKDTHEIVYVTRIGGSAYDLASRLAIDPEGNAWVAGFTKSADFPVTADAWQKAYGGEGDAFLMKLSPAGDMLFSTFIGGPRLDFGNAIAIAGGQPILGGSSGGDGFVQYGPSKRVTFGGSGEEKLTGIAHHRGKVHATGYTKSNDWKTLQGPSDAFVVTLNLDRMAVESARYFGGTGEDSAWGIAVDPRGRVVIAGQTTSNHLPGSGRGFQRTNHGGADAFVARIGGPATYFGGSGKDEAGYDGQNIAIDTSGSVWIAGITYSTDLPAAGSYGGGDGDGFIARFAPDLGKVQFASYVGGQGRELGEGIAIVPGGAAMTMVRFGGETGIDVGPFRAQSVISFWLQN
ncbi:MAG: SBBP repeat-containing protein [Bryobacteraceae bacterium]